MFVTKSRFVEVEQRAQRFENQAYHYFTECKRIGAKWDALVDRINGLGGEAFLKRARIPSETPAQFTADELQRLILLCHPDKHDGKPMATEMTQKLLKMKAVAP
jgi:hypothetical protein